MKILILILLLAMPMISYAQNTNEKTITINKKKLIGRWTETHRTNTEGEKLNLKHKDSFIFKEDLCHRGEVTTGVILFDVTGRYQITGNTVSVTYFDLLGKRNVPKNTVLRLVLTIVSMSDQEIIAHVKDHTFSEYIVTLQKTIIK